MSEGRATLATVLSTCPLNISFRRSLSCARLGQWLELVEKVGRYELNNKNDIFVWTLNKSSKFTVKSMYRN